MDILWCTQGLTTTGYFNHRHRRAGHLFQGRFKAHLVEEQGYFLQISRYLHLNPVRAKLVRSPEEWRWSSYRATEVAATLGYRVHSSVTMAVARVEAELARLRGTLKEIENQLAVDN